MEITDKRITPKVELSKLSAGTVFAHNNQIYMLANKTTLGELQGSLYLYALNLTDGSIQGFSTLAEVEPLPNAELTIK